MIRENETSHCNDTTPHVYMTQLENTNYYISVTCNHHIFRCSWCGKTCSSTLLSELNASCILGYTKVNALEAVIEKMMSQEKLYGYAQS
jgi:hypothetical protein